MHVHRDGHAAARRRALALNVSSPRCWWTVGEATTSAGAGVLMRLRQQRNRSKRMAESQQMPLKTQQLHGRITANAIENAASACVYRGKRH